MQGDYKFYNPKYTEKTALLTEFITSFKEASRDQSQQLHGDLKYMNLLQKVANKQTIRVDIMMEDLEEYFNSEKERSLVDAIQKNTARFVDILSKVCDAVMPPRTTQLTPDEELESMEQVLNDQRMSNMEGDQNKDDNIRNRLNPLLFRKFQLFITRGPNTKQKVIPIRNLKSEDIGSLVTIKAIVVRVTDVKPMMQVACYICDTCGSELYQGVTGRTFTPLQQCISNTCKTNRTRGKVVISASSSVFTPYQEIRVQETSDQIPHGNIPRRFLVISKGVNVRQCAPGDLVTIQGVFHPLQNEDFAARSNLIMETQVEAYSITKQKKSYSDFEINEEVQEKILEMRDTMSEEQIYELLARSIAPEIYGNEDVKKALLLLMVGGSTLEMKDGMRIRGDINMAMIGDPGVAKSQLLKHIARISPRGIYTTGKGSSGVGLTASLIKDPITNEMSLEAGALVLADMGVCCIDEFDKMNEYDRTSIHEVMEQQTVSIAKAGMATSLNARTSILAAANPLYGRYNKKLSPHRNINLPFALLSRFDLVFILLDNADQQNDTQLAKHICHVHKTLQAPKVELETVNPNVIKAYISQAKKYQPTLDKELHDFLVKRYLEKRQEQVETGKEGYSYTTPRTLLGIVRLSQSLARLRLSDAVSQRDVDEALRLMEESQKSVRFDEDDENKNKEKTKLNKDYQSNIYDIIRKLFKKQNKAQISVSELQKQVNNKGYSVEQLYRTLDQYENLGVIMTSKDEQTITLVRDSEAVN